MMGADDSICDEMRTACEGIWEELHGHPFLRELAAGTLPLEKFRFFLEQDNFYLVDYARCLAMGAAKSRDEDELRYFTADLNEVIDAELPSNRELLARVIAMGAEDRGGALTQAPANVAYTSYMLSQALRGGPVEIMAVLLPCAWSYAEIAGRLTEQGVTDHEVYADWVGYFADQANVEMVASMRADLDRLAVEGELGPDKREELSQIFATSCRLEHGFWEMAYSLKQWPDLHAN